MDIEPNVNQQHADCKNKNNNIIIYFSRKYLLFLLRDSLTE